MADSTESFETRLAAVETGLAALSTLSTLSDLVAALTDRIAAVEEENRALREAEAALLADEKIDDEATAQNTGAIQRNTGLIATLQSQVLWFCAGCILFGCAVGYALTRIFG